MDGPARPDLSRNLNVAAGATIVLVAAALFAVSLVIAPRRGAIPFARAALGRLATR